MGAPKTMESAIAMVRPLARVPLPLTAVHILHADVAKMGYLRALELAPYWLLSRPIGLWFDRRGHQLVAADFARVLLLLVVPALYRGASDEPPCI